MQALLVDCMTRDRLVDPVLASDGMTYSRASLLGAMRHDPLHRSPITGEVLRPWAFRNRVIASLLHHVGRAAKDDVDDEDVVDDDDDVDDDDKDVDDDDDCVQLWPAGGDQACGAAESPLSGADALSVCSFQVAARPSADMAAVFVATGVDALVKGDYSALVFSVQCLRDKGGALRAMHPPPPEEFWDLAVRTAALVAGRTTFVNPWCFAGATVSARGLCLGTLETVWLSNAIA